MNGTLRQLLLGLVLLNLAFVHLTAAVDATWLGGLWLGALAAPLCGRWRERAGWRHLWNAAVLTAFAFLVVDAATSGLLHMLEDGLLLAALCQVHLLNNLGSRQRPDLLFFNSFLIAFVTSFFCTDLGWSLCFCAYAAVLVPALQVFVATREHVAMAPAAVRALVRDGLPRSAAALLLTAIAFVAWPRDFRRDGWLGDALQLGAAPMVGFADEVRLDRSATPTLDDREVMRIRGERAQVPSHWRGATFVAFDGAGWQPFRPVDLGTGSATDQPWTLRGSAIDRPAHGDGRQLQVRLLDLEAARLFLPFDAVHCELADADGGTLLRPRGDAIVWLGVADARRRVDVRVDLAELPPTAISARARGSLLQPPRRVPRALADLAAQLRDDLPADATDHAIALHTASWLAARRNYALPGTQAAARSFDDFVLGTGGGHCEHFATALALLLRLQRVPCRVVTGYLAHEWDDSRGECVVRRRDAHAWVEAHTQDRGWITVDATPADAARPEPVGASLWQQALGSLRSAWQAVAGFRATDRAALFAWFAQLPHRAWAAAQQPLMQGGLLAGLAALAVAAALLARRRRRPAAVGRLEQAIRRCGLTRRPDETPRELLARAAGEPMAAAALPALARAVAAHEADRFAAPRQGTATRTHRR